MIVPLDDKCNKVIGNWFNVQGVSFGYSAIKDYVRVNNLIRVFDFLNPFAPWSVYDDFTLATEIEHSRKKESSRGTIRWTCTYLYRTMNVPSKLEGKRANQFTDTIDPPSSITIIRIENRTIIDQEHCEGEVTAAIDRSRKKLQTDEIDLVGNPGVE